MKLTSPSAACGPAWLAFNRDEVDFLRLPHRAMPAAAGKAAKTKAGDGGQEVGASSESEAQQVPKQCRLFSSFAGLVVILTRSCSAAAAQLAVMVLGVMFLSTGSSALDSTS
jgi:hypothetical protein